MTTYSLKSPAALKRQLQSELPQRPAATLGVIVTPRDREGRNCPAFWSDCYEVQAFYTRSSPEALDQLEEAVRTLPGVRITTQIRDDGTGRRRNEVTNPEWPAALRRARRGNPRSG